MTITFIVVLAIVVGLTIGIKVYLQERDAQKALEQESKEKEALAKTNEQIVNERLAEIAQFEKQIAEVDPTVVNETKVEKKATPKKKKYYAPKKTQAKGKSKQ